MQVRPGDTLTREDSSGPNVSAQEHSLPENYIKVGLCVHISVICIIYTVYTIIIIIIIRVTCICIGLSYMYIQCTVNQ